MNASHEYNYDYFGKGFSPTKTSMMKGVNMLLVSANLRPNGTIDPRRKIECKKYLWNYLHYLSYNNKSNPLKELDHLGKTNTIQDFENLADHIVKTNVTKKIRKMDIIEYINKLILRNQSSIRIPMLTKIQHKTRVVKNRTNIVVSRTGNEPEKQIQETTIYLSQPLSSSEYQNRRNNTRIEYKNVNATKNANVNVNNVVSNVNVNTTSMTLENIKVELDKIDQINKDVQYKIDVLQEQQVMLMQKKKQLEKMNSSNVNARIQSELKDLKIEALTSDMKEQEHMNILKLNKLKAIILQLHERNDRDSECKEMLKILKGEIEKCRELRDTIDKIATNVPETIPINVKPLLNVKFTKKNANSGSINSSNSVTLNLKKPQPPMQ